MALLLASGCVTPPSFDTVRQSLPPLTGIDGRVFFYRPTGDGDRIATSVRVDGVVVGRAIPNGFFYRDMPAGDYRITASRNTDHVMPLRLAAGETKYIRIDLWLRATRWTFTTELVDATAALAELDDTAYMGDRAD